jgi:hypothetical protein
MGNLISSFLHKYESIVSPPRPINNIPEVIIPRNRIFTNINHSKKGLIIGINYISNNTKNDDLNGCVNDLVKLKAFLKQRCFFSKGQIKTLENKEANKENIINEINNLVEYSNKHPQSELWFSYSGHGTSKHSFFEKDNKSEVICPCDYYKNGIIDDLWLQTNFIKKLNPKTKLFVLMDCCNSGSNMNLPYCYVNGEEQEREYNYDTESNLCTVLKISGCKDHQTSADYYDFSDGEYQGALTNSFLKVNHYDKIHENISSILDDLKERNFIQQPVLAFSNKGDYNISLI